jgi:hypothetical protein
VLPQAAVNILQMTSMLRINSENSPWDIQLKWTAPYTLGIVCAQRDQSARVEKPHRRTRQQLLVSKLVFFQRNEFNPESQPKGVPVRFQPRH